MIIKTKHANIFCNVKCIFKSGQIFKYPKT